MYILLDIFAQVTLTRTFFNLISLLIITYFILRFVYICDFGDSGLVTTVSTCGSLMFLPHFDVYWTETRQHGIYFISFHILFIYYITYVKFRSS